MDSAGLLAAYDSQLRGETEAVGAVSVTRQGPLLLAVFPGGSGFITGRDFGGLDAEAIGFLVGQALAYFQADAAVAEVEWKTRAHDHAPGLTEALLAHGFRPDEPESIMLGEARSLAADVPLPDGVTLRRVSAETDVRAMTAMQDEVFGRPVSGAGAGALLARLAHDDGLELWVAEAGGRMVSAGRLDPVPGTDFAGIWGGSTLPQWRGRGIYRALTAQRARSALRRGKTCINSDSTECSRPILERSGFVRVSATTPYLWRRPG